jgi:hypothetical protein
VQDLADEIAKLDRAGLTQLVAELPPEARAALRDALQLIRVRGAVARYERKRARG